MKVYFKYIIVCCLLINSNFLFSQEEANGTIPLTERYTIFEGDTLLIELDEVFLLKKINLPTSYERKYYYWFRKKVLKAYPYAQIAADSLEILNANLDKIKSSRKKKAYTKTMQKYMEEEFTDQLKKLTRMEGRILIKLLDRQTGVVAYDLVKDYRSGWKAFWYNTTANVFKLSLKDGYDPMNNNEDLLIENILQRASVEGIITLKPSKKDLDYTILAEKPLIIPQPKEKK
ncbi:DUF4294 domain-containing protein [Lutibacter sp. HS1-25]|uniref:DUF4294 domain-containing protein n=1 Tax=Lutibacter sp. HS1-25 TaxID=2485000 RepID=UPI001011611E|nr:DUF4294 domain-containing protein [Lutibacter sp. HS1-25]RXP63495.1 DUF4294 domain-containing protein [Lutibacter sp. HS1-25]